MKCDEQLARFMHEKYEEYAKTNGWETQKDCKVAFDDLPQNNQQTMLEVAREIVRRMCTFDTFQHEFEIIDSRFENGDKIAFLFCRKCGKVVKVKAVDET